LDLVQLDEAAQALCRTYSFGMKRKLALAGALLHRPRVLILDEPFNGLDPRAARRLKDLLVRLAGEGCGIFLSTHDLATAEAMCSRFGVLHRGRLVAEGRSASELRERWGGEGAAGDLEEIFLELTEEGGGELRGTAA
jgi:ABC-2 type transport system ATP-binding protein